MKKISIGKGTMSEDVTLNDLSEILTKGHIKIKRLSVEKQSLLDGVALKNTNLPKNVLIGPLARGEKAFLPDGSTVLQSDDQLILFGRQEDIEFTKTQLEGITLGKKIKKFLTALFIKK